MKKKGYVRLTFEDRVKIETYRKEKKSITFIAQKLKRHKSTISREINPWTRGKGDRYEARLAHWYARESYRNKRCFDKISVWPKLKFYVYRKLLEQWSPQQIAGRIKIDHPNDPVMSISHEAIYTHIYQHPQGKLCKKLIALLYLHRSRRKKTYVSRGVLPTKMTGTVSIEQRPAHINDRSQIGHWEGDLMIGPRQKSAIATLVERKSRFTYILKLDNRRSETVTTQIRDALLKLPKKLRGSITYDNGSEMANHKWLTQQTGATVYFAHPHSSWERGTNENTNGIIRRFLPKQTDFHAVTFDELLAIQHKINNRPRKVLGYRTPAEAFPFKSKTTTTTTIITNVGVRK